LLRHQARDEADAKKIIKVLAPLAQKRGAACLNENDARLAVRTELDGVQTEGGGDLLAAAIEQLKPQRIVGAGHLKTRDDAMVAGEAGVDYLMFGGPDVDETADSILERVAWWADIFNVPCVGYAQSLKDIGGLVRAGADFVAVCGALWDDPRGVEAALKDITQILTEAKVAVP
jgi:thiamine-phosphate pyrophosphorylase